MTIYQIVIALARQIVNGPPGTFVTVQRTFNGRVYSLTFKEENAE